MQIGYGFGAAVGVLQIGMDAESAGTGFFAANGDVAFAEYGAGVSLAAAALFALLFDSVLRAFDIKGAADIGVDASGMGLGTVQHGIALAAELQFVRFPHGKDEAAVLLRLIPGFQTASA